MKVRVTIELELELNDSIELNDTGLSDMVNEDIIESLSDLDMDFQTSDDRDIEVKSVTGTLIDTDLI